MLDKNSLVTIIDGDTIPWIVGYNYRDSDDTISALSSVDSYVQSLIDNTSCTHYIGFLGGTKCFRYDIARHKPYKGNRPDSPDWYKKWGGVMKAHLRDKWGFLVVNGIEADDAVACARYDLEKKGINCILCHADKDLRQLEGNHYNLRTHKREYIDKKTAVNILYKQVLIGDPSDNIEGLKGWGKAKADKLIDNLPSDAMIYTYVRQEFINKYGIEEGRVMFKEMYKLCALLEIDDTLELNYIEVKREDIKIDQDNTTILEDILNDLWG